MKTWARSESGYRATGARTWSSSSWENFFGVALLSWAKTGEGIAISRTRSQISIFRKDFNVFMFIPRWTSDSRSRVLLPVPASHGRESLPRPHGTYPHKTHYSQVNVSRRVWFTSSKRICVFNGDNAAGPVPSFYKIRQREGRIKKSGNKNSSRSSPSSL